MSAVLSVLLQQLPVLNRASLWFGVRMQQSELVFVGRSFGNGIHTDLFTASENVELIYKTANLAAKVGNYVGISMGCFEI